MTGEHALPLQSDLGPLPDRPLISVVIPSFNQGRFIKQTIESILIQNHRPIEIIIVDGQSTDETLQVLQEYADCEEVKWTSEPDDGVVDAVNKGFQRVNGDIVAIQSSDDCYLPDAFDHILKAFADDEHLGLVYGDTVKVDSRGQELARYRSGPFGLESLFLFRTWIPQPAAFFRRQILHMVGGWDARIPYTPDTDLWIRMAFRTRVRKVDEFIATRRMHDEQRDQHADRIIRDYTKMIAQSADIKGAPFRLRRAAHAGTYLLRVRYNPSGSTLYSAWNLLRAAIAFPRCFEPKQFFLTVCYYPVHRGLSRMKRFCLRLSPGA